MKPKRHAQSNLTTTIHHQPVALSIWLKIQVWVPENFQWSISKKRGQPHGVYNNIWKCLTKNFPSSNFSPRIGRILGWIVCSSEIWQFFALYRNPPGKFLFHLHLFHSRSFGLIESTLWYWSLTAFRTFISSGTSVPSQRATKSRSGRSYHAKTAGR